VHVLELILHICIIPVKVERIRTGRVHARRAVVQATWRYGPGLSDLRRAIAVGKVNIAVTLLSLVLPVLAIPIHRLRLFCWIRRRSNVGHTSLALVPLGRLSWFVMAQMANVALDAARAWSLKVARHVRTAAVYAGMIDLAPLLLAIVTVADLGLFPLGRTMDALRRLAGVLLAMGEAVRVGGVVQCALLVVCGRGHVRGFGGRLPIRSCRRSRRARK
jgi:hypothetical protein